MELPQSTPESQESLPNKTQSIRGQGCALIAIFAKFVAAEAAKWSKVAKASGATVD